MRSASIRLQTFLPCVCAALCLILFSGCDSKVKGSPDALLHQACAAALRGEWARTLECAQAVCEQDKNNTDALVLTALAYENGDSQDEALDRIEKAARDRKHFMAQYTYGRMLVARGRCEQALMPLKIACELRPADRNALLLQERAAAVCRTGDVANLCKQLRNGIAEFGYDRQTKRYRSPFVLNELGLYYALRKNYKYANEAFLLAEKADGDAPAIQLNLAILNDCLLDRPVAAKPYYEKFLSLAGGNSGAYRDEIRSVRERLREIR